MRRRMLASKMSWYYARHTPGDPVLPVAARHIGEHHIVLHELSGLEQKGYGWLLIDAQCTDELEIWCVEAQRDEDGWLGLRFIAESEEIDRWDPPAPWLDTLGDVELLYGNCEREQERAREWRSLAGILSAQLPDS